MKQNLKTTTMKTKILLITCTLLISIQGFGKIWIVTNNGFTFSPATLTINKGDSVTFEIGLSHNVTEVSESTWNSNGNTALENGFQLPLGGGTLLPEQLTIGTHFYVCTPHASLGMKGTIVVQDVVSGINDQLVSRFSVYPNPARDFITIRSNSENGSDYRITNIFGKRILDGKLENGTTTVDINELSPGIYFVQVGNNKNQNFKIIKE